MTHLFDPDDLGQTFKITLGSAEIEYQTYAAKNWKGHTSWLADHNGQTCRCIELGPLFWSAKLEATDGAMQRIRLLSVDAKAVLLRALRLAF